MVIGITGSFCTGKSKVASIFRELGAGVIDLDKLAHRALKPKSKSFKEVVKEFGRDILVNKRIDRLILAGKVFGNKKRITKLNSIIHPVVIKDMLNLLKSSSKRYKIIAIEAPLLFEAGLKKYFDYIIVVKADKNIQIRRAMRKTRISKANVLKRINSQWPIGRKVKLADFIIDNSGSINKTRRQIKEIWEGLKTIC